MSLTEELLRFIIPHCNWDQCLSTFSNYDLSFNFVSFLCPIPCHTGWCPILCCIYFSHLHTNRILWGPQGDTWPLVENAGPGDDGLRRPSIIPKVTQFIWSQPCMHRLEIDDSLNPSHCYNKSPWTKCLTFTPYLFLPKFWRWEAGIRILEWLSFVKVPILACRLSTLCLSLHSKSQWKHSLVFLI